MCSPTSQANPSYGQLNAATLLQMQVPGGAAGCYLLGKLHSLTDNPSTAISCYQAALIKDPLLWSAYEGLCQLGSPLVIRERQCMALWPVTNHCSKPLGEEWSDCCCVMQGTARMLQPSSARSGRMLTVSRQRQGLRMPLLLLLPSRRRRASPLMRRPSCPRCTRHGSMQAGSEQ